MKLKKTTLLIFLYLILFNFCEIHAKNCSTTGSGNFGGAIWTCSPAGMPACGDVITIAVGHTVTVSNNFQWHNGGCASSPTTIIVNGTLAFSGGGKLQLAAGSNVIINPGGSLEDDNYTGNNNLIDIGGTNIWNASVEGGPVSGPWQNGNSTLPITLKSFYGFQENSSIQLYWSTASESNNNYFSIERSEDGENWNSIGIHNGGNNSNTELYYGFTDNNPLNGSSFYRLVQTDYDGESETFLPIIINFIEKSTFLMFPNPTNENVTISFNENFYFNQIKIYDMYGKIIHIYNVDFKPSVTLDILFIIRGIYFVSCEGDGYVSTQKLVVE